MIEGYPGAEVDKPREECGVIGIYAPNLYGTNLAYRGLQVLQHRGEEGAGIASSDGKNLFICSDLGKVENVFGHDGQFLTTIPDIGSGVTAGHVRWGTFRGVDTTNGEKIKRAVASLQPMLFESTNNPFKKFTISVNGHVEGLTELAIEQGVDILNVISDTSQQMDIIGAVYERRDSIEDALLEVLPEFKGAFSMIITTPDRLIAARDPHGTRPLNLGWIEDEGWVIASERSALNITGAKFTREIDPGEMIVIKGLSDVRSYNFMPEQEKIQPAVCAYEFIYLSRPDNVIEGESVYSARVRMGELLAIGDDVEVDVVIGVPESGRIAAKGYARARGLLDEEWITKNNYVGRSFIAPEQQQRSNMVRMKLSPIEDMIMGKRLLIVDDSMIRGTTQKELVQMLRRAGATEVHGRFTAPRYEHTCHSGMDTGNRNELIAAHLTDQEICDFTGLDSIKFLTVEQLQQGVGKAAGRICVGCATGVYPSEITVPVQLFPK